jgi:dTDP-4-dehydrorhamnose reductase
LGLIEWFLAQEGRIAGFTRAIFSGFPTVTLANLMVDFLLDNPDMTGLYHLSAAPIPKYELLRLVAGEYGKKIEITPEAEPEEDRSLDSAAFRKITGYAPPSWPELVAEMHRHYLRSSFYKK